MCLRCLYVANDKQTEDENLILVQPRTHLKSVESFGFIKQGSESKCQDTFTIMPNLTPYVHFFAIYDGAGEQGSDVVHQVETTMRSYIERNQKKLQTIKKEEDIRNFLVEGFAGVQNVLDVYKLGYEHSKSGACCTCVLIVRNIAYVANIGNCRAVLCTTKREGVGYTDLSSDHTLENKQERERCVRAGAKISQAPLSEKEKILGPERIWYNNEGPGITTTRMLGYNKQGIISEPEIVSFEIRGNDRFMVLGSDGLWDVLGSKDVVETVSQIREKKNASEEIVLKAASIWEKECDKQEYRLVGDDVTQKAGDDVSVVIVYFNYSKK